jgi:hypothetical protein
MAVVVEHPVSLPPPKTIEVDERAARRALRGQITKLERELAAAFVDAFPRQGIDFGAARAPGGPRMLTLGELERIRDDLADRLAGVRRQLHERAEEEERKRELLECMLLEPGRYKWVKVTARELGRGDCGAYHVRPRLGIVGMLMGWWQVKVSSGCPLPRSHPSRRPWLRPCLLASGARHAGCVLATDDPGVTG